MYFGDNCLHKNYLSGILEDFEFGNRIVSLQAEPRASRVEKTSKSKQNGKTDSFIILLFPASQRNGKMCNKFGSIFTNFANDLGFNNQFEHQVHCSPMRNRSENPKKPDISKIKKWEKVLGVLQKPI